MPSTIDELLAQLARFVLATCAVLSISGVTCGPAGPPVPPEPERCFGVTMRDPDAGASLDGSPPRVVTLGTGEGATFSPWSAGATATVITGFQGGAMILPTVRVTARPTEGDTLCLHIELRNALSDGSEVLPGVSADFIFVRVGDVFEAANLFDQLGSSGAAFRGKTLMLVADVNGVTFTATATMSLVLG